MCPSEGDLETFSPVYSAASVSGLQSTWSLRDLSEARTVANLAAEIERRMLSQLDSMTEEEAKGACFSRRGEILGTSLFPSLSHLKRTLNAPRD